MIRKVTVFASSPTDVMPERERAARVIERLQSRFREYVTIAPIFFEEKERYYTADKSFQEQIPDAAAADLLISIFWSRLGSPLAPDVFGTMPDGRPYPGGAVYELLKALEGKRKKSVPDILVYRKVADTGISVTDADQRRVMTAQLDAFEAFWREWFVSAEGHFRAGYQKFKSPDEFEQLLEQHLRGWLDEQGLLGREVIWRIAERGSPFRGLAPYEPEHAEVFFGREREIDRGRERLLAAAGAGVGFLLVMGPSGAGKSSLVRAGLLTRLTQPGDIDGADVVRVATMRPGQAATPQHALAEALLQGLPEVAAGDYREPEQLAAALGGDVGVATIPILRAIDRAAAGTRVEKHHDRPVAVRLLLLIDQLEELFAATVGDAARHAFVQLLAALARSGHALVIATLRSSSYGELARMPELAALKDAGAALDLAVPGPEVLAEIVRRPAASAGLTFEHRGDRSLDEVLLAAAGGNADALPLLGFTLQWLFEHREGERLTFAAYDQLGGLEGAIGRAAEQAFAGIDEPAQAALPQLLRGLAEAPRRREAGLALRDLPLATAPIGTPLRKLAEALVAARVLLVHGEGEHAMLRLAHDAVLRGWQRARDIVEKEQDFYRIRDEVGAAQLRWRDQKHNDLLLAPGLPLAEAQLLKARYGAELEPELVAYVDASTQRDLRRQRRGFALAGVFGLVALAAIGAGLLAWHQQRIAVDHRDRALLTQSRFLADLAHQQSQSGDHATGLLLALEALPDARAGVSRPYAAEAEAAAFDGVQGLQELRILAHSGEVWGAVYSRDGRRLLTASSDGAAHLWDTATGMQTRAFQGPGGGGVPSAKFSPDERRVIMASGDATARIWDTETGQMLVALPGDQVAVSSVAFSPDGRRAVTAAGKDVRIWDAESGRALVLLQGHLRDVDSAAFSADGRRVLTVSDDASARVWDAETGKELIRFTSPEGLRSGPLVGGWSAVFSADGHRLMTFSHAEQPIQAHVWDTETGKELFVLKHSGGGELFALAFSPDGRWIATGGNDKTAHIWSAETGKQITVLTFDSNVTELTFSPDLRRLAAVAGGRIHLWETGRRDKILVAAADGHDSIRNPVFSPDGSRIATSSQDKTTRIWSTEANRNVIVLLGHESPVKDVALSPDGRRVATASWDGTARVWNAAAGVQELSIAVHGKYLEGVAFSPGGDRIATASGDNTARIWDATTGNQITVLAGHEGALSSVTFSPDGRRILTASSDGTARVWDPADGQQLLVLRGHQKTVWRAAFSADGRRVVTASSDNTARIWDAQDGRQLAVLQGHENEVLAAAFSGDGHRVVTGGGDGTVRIWDADTAQEIALLKSGNGFVHDVAYSPDGKRVIAALDDKTARLWDLGTGKVVAVLRGHGDRPIGRYGVGNDAVNRAIFDREGRHVLTASDDKTARIWPIFPTTQALVDHAKQVVPRCLSVEQRERAFLDPEPPAWCIEMAKWPYGTEAWKSWLAQKRAGQNPPLPDAEAQ